jgi:thiol-disulfide isomerase/thioredoxin
VGEHCYGDTRIRTRASISLLLCTVRAFLLSRCPPCRNFTPSLVNFYNTIGASEKITIIFVSGDRDTAAFEDYFGSMPYHAVPFTSKDIIKQLNKTYKVQGIPCLVVVDAKTGNVITKDGRSDVGAAGDGKDEAKAKLVVTNWKSAESKPPGGCTIS